MFDDADTEVTLGWMEAVPVVTILPISVDGVSEIDELFKLASLKVTV